MKVSFRQLATPHHLLGRMSGPAGPRAALWAGAVGLALVWLPVFFSPVRGMRHPLDDAQAAGPR